MQYTLLFCYAMSKIFCNSLSCFPPLYFYTFFLSIFKFISISQWLSNQMLLALWFQFLSHKNHSVITTLILHKFCFFIYQFRRCIFLIVDVIRSFLVYRIHASYTCIIPNKHLFWRLKIREKDSKFSVQLSI